MSQQRGRPRNAVAPRPRADVASANQPVSAKQKERVRAVIEPVLAAAGYDLEDLVIQRVGRRHLLRIAVDSDTGVNLDQIADLSRDISAGLDAAEAEGDVLIAGEYELEVGSRGVDRPLTEPRHWRRNIGRLVQVKAGERQLTARIIAVDDSGVVLEKDRFTFAELGPGRIQVELKRIEEAGDLGGDDLDDDDDGEDEE
jgi:ribosome maturation factor RimP